METKRNFGMILFLVGVFMLLDKTGEFEGIVAQLKSSTQQYWPFFLCVIGLYFLSTPSQK